jgi:signal-transduction protein with cAMP-binding, CBS, and nucleotidyltransferase domain
MPTGLTAIREIMSKGVFGIEPGTRVLEALDVASEHSVTHLPVVDGGRVVGVVCTCDLEEAQLDLDVSAVMHSPAVTVESNVLVADAAVVMAAHGVGSVLVMTGDRLDGIVTRSDFERVGLAEAAFGDQRCSVCRGYQHVHLSERCGYFLCATCRAAARPAREGSELGGGD